MTPFEFHHGVHLSCLVVASFMLHSCGINFIPSDSWLNENDP